MSAINKEIFLEQNADSKILNNVTKYCNECYKEFEENEFIYFDVDNYRYLCNQCACCISEELETKQECLMDDCNEEGSLF